jgi:osmotically-inducible protein OsmY
MKSFKSIPALVATTLLALTIACSNQNKAPDVSQNVRHALDQAGFNNVGVSQDREKNVVTLGGNVNSDDDKSRAESVAKSAAGPVVVADEIGVRPSGEEGTAKKVDTERDSGIDKNLEAMLVQHKLNKDVKYDVSNGVVALKGDVPSQAERSSAEKVAKHIPNVKQVVNELEVKHKGRTPRSRRPRLSVRIASAACSERGIG